jgi:flagellar capping protein FliD
MMQPAEVISIIAVSGTFLTAIASLIQNNKVLNKLEKHWDERFSDLKELLKLRFDAIDKRLDSLDARVKVLEDESRARLVR